MANAVIMPRQGISVESCIITQWNKKVGDKVEVGDLLFSYETDKASFEEEAQVAGTMLAILREESDDVPCLENVCVIGQVGEDISQYMTAEISEKTEVVQEEKEVIEKVAAVEAKSDGERLFISPRAKKLASDSNADLSKATASGPNGRIIERDVMELIKNGIKTNNVIDEDQISATNTTPNVANAPIESEYEDIKLSNVRKVIAKAMHASLSNMAQLTLNSSFDASAIMALRKQFKANAAAMGLNNITLNDILLYAVTKTLARHKELNAHYLDDRLRIFRDVNLGIAVDTSRGLLVPTLFGSNKLTLNELSAASSSIISDAKSGSINPDMLSGGTFTVTNLGTLGVESFTPVINPPQTAILGVCTIKQEIKVVDGEIKAYPSMGLSLTFDHRAVDGAPAAKFLKDLCAALENINITMAM